MEEEKRDFVEDVSKNIEESSREGIVPIEIAQKEEIIAKAVTEMPIIKDELAERKTKIINFFKHKKDAPLDGAFFEI